MSRLISLNEVFKKKNNNYDPFISQKLRKKENLEYVLYKSIQAIYGVLNRKEFTVPKQVKEETETYIRENNPVATFLFEMYTDEEIAKIPSTELFQSFGSWAADNNYRSRYKPGTFGKEMKKLGYESVQSRVNGGRQRFYIKQENFEQLSLDVTS